MGKGWKKSNWNRAAGCKFTGKSLVSKEVLWVRLETSFDAIPVIDTGANRFHEEVLGAVGVAGVVDRPDEETGEPDALVETADKK
jgi:hypothetical protein